MLSGIISGFPIFVKFNYQDVKSKKDFYYCNIITDDGFTIGAILPIEFYREYQHMISKNTMFYSGMFSANENENLDASKLALGLPEDTENFITRFMFYFDLKFDESAHFLLTKLHCKITEMVPESKDFRVPKSNLVSLDGAATRYKNYFDGSLCYKIACNKTILNSKEKNNKATYVLLKTPNDVDLQLKDIVATTAKIVSSNGVLRLEALDNLKVFSNVRNIVDVVLDSKQDLDLDYQLNFNLLMKNKKMIEQMGYKVFLIPLSKLINDKRMPNEVQFTNVQSNPSHIDMILNYTSEGYSVYDTQIAQSLGMNPNTEFSPLIHRFDYLREDGRLHVIIPLIRLHKGCNCGAVFVKEDIFTEGLIRYNRTFGQFPIKITKERHLQKAKEFYYRFVDFLEQINMDIDSFKMQCPKINPSLEFNAFCSNCEKAERRRFKENEYKDNDLKWRA